MVPLFIRLFFVVALACAAPGAALAGPLSDGDAQKVQGVIVAQLEALASDDADRAFETATPEVREAIGSSLRFLAMVRVAYPMVYRNAAVTFHKPREAEGGVLQLVEITDDDSKSWLVVFALERQPDESWRISGCMAAENHWKSI